MVDRDLCLLAISGLASVGAAISTFEWLANWRQFSELGLLSWKNTQRQPRLVRGPLGPVFKAILGYPNILIFFAVRLGALLALQAAMISGQFVVWTLGLVFATSLLLNLRGSDGLDGSDQMTTQIFGALFLGYLPGTDLALDAALWFIALQSCLSYAAAGIAKAFSPAWRDGSAVFAVFNTRTYGHPGAARFLSRRPAWTRMLTWGAMVAEITFPLSLLVGFPWLLVFLAWGALFHAMNAVVMGFNRFFWVFVATYPAIVYCAAMLAG